MKEKLLDLWAVVAYVTLWALLSLTVLGAVRLGQYLWEQLS